MRVASVIVLCLFVRSPAPAPSGGIVLAGEPIHFDSGSVRFTPRQIEQTSEAVRAGLVRWAATRQGRRLLRHFTTAEYRIVVREDFDEPGIGRAPEPGILTFLATGDRAKTKTYELILNPTPWKLPAGATALPNEPATTADLLAAAWAAEMLHIYLYSKGIRLPHHERSEFQEQWLAVARELGFPGMTHGDRDVVPRRRPSIAP